MCFLLTIRPFWWRLLPDPTSSIICVLTIVRNTVRHDRYKPECSRRQIQFKTESRSLPRTCHRCALIFVYLGQKLICSSRSGVLPFNLKINFPFFLLLLPPHKMYAYKYNQPYGHTDRMCAHIQTGTSVCVCVCVDWEPNLSFRDVKKETLNIQIRTKWRTRFYFYVRATRCCALKIEHTVQTECARIYVCSM